MLCLDRTYTLFLCAHFLRAWSGAQVEVREWKVRHLERNLSIHVKKNCGGAYC